MSCSVGCTWACALRRKMYDPQRVEGTSPSGLLLTESIKQHLGSLCQPIPPLEISMLHFTLVSKKIQSQAEQLPNLEIWGGGPNAGWGQVLLN